MSQEYTFKGILRARHTDWLNYVTYVFEDLEPSDPDFKYVMCTQFPNWVQAYVSMGETGFITVRYVKEGVDTWYDGTSFVPYRNTGVHFIRFIPIKEPVKDVDVGFPDGESDNFIEVELND